MFNRYFILTLAIIISIPLCISAMELPKESIASYITQCCSKYLTKTDLQNYTHQTENSACPFCKSSPFKTNSVICRICEEESIINAPSLDCKHNFYCSGCLENIINNALREKTTQAMRCPECKIRFNEQSINTITKNNNDMLNKIYDVMTLELFKKNRDAKNCPTSSCSYMYLAHADINPSTIDCPVCKAMFCSHCTKNHSETISCKKYEENLSIDKNEADKNSEEWIKNNTKPCPSCTKLIQWDGACTNITCTQCQHFFCYECLETLTKDFAHHCTVQQSTTITQPKPNENTLLIELLEAMQLPPKSNHPIPTASLLSKNNYAVHFDRPITSSEFDNFVKFITRKSKISLITTYESFESNQEMLLLEATENLDTIIQLIKEANIHSFE